MSCRIFFRPRKVQQLSKPRKWLEKPRGVQKVFGGKRCRLGFKNVGGVIGLSKIPQVRPLACCAKKHVQFESCHYGGPPTDTRGVTGSLGGHLNDSVIVPVGGHIYMYLNIRIGYIIYTLYHHYIVILYICFVLCLIAEHIYFILLYIYIMHLISYMLNRSQSDWSHWKFCGNFPDAPRSGEQSHLRSFWCYCLPTQVEDHP